ncbi:MAG: BON domain-containing protein [Pseudomonadota bacterium]
MKPITTLLASAVVMSTLAACTGPGILVGAGAAGTRSVLQERSTGQALTDLEIEVSIANRLGNHSGELYRDVDVDVHEGRVLLAGSVPEREDKIFASQQAWEVPGVTQVSDELTVEEDSGTKAYLNDVWISNKVRFELLTTMDVRSVNINVTTVDRIVHMTGIARSEDELFKALDVAAGVDGVNKVVSHIVVIDDPRRVEQLAKSG